MKRNRAIAWVDDLPFAIYRPALELEDIRLDRSQQCRTPRRLEEVGSIVETFIDADEELLKIPRQATNVCKKGVPIETSGIGLCPLGLRRNVAEVLVRWLERVEGRRHRASELAEESHEERW